MDHTDHKKVSELPPFHQRHDKVSTSPKPLCSKTDMSLSLSLSTYSGSVKFRAPAREHAPAGVSRYPPWGFSTRRARLYHR